MSDEIAEDVMEAGARARALGRSLFDNPYLKTEMLPASTGESVTDWQTKHDGWEIGWRIEDAILSP